MLKILITSLILISHPVHVSILSIDYTPENDSFKVFIKMYFDDFLLDYRLSGGNRQEPEIATEMPASKDRIVMYLNDRVTIYVNDRQVSGRISDYEITDGEIILNLIYGKAGKTNSITVKNSIMTRLYSDQTNMVLLRVNDFEEGIKLTSEKTEQTFFIK
jgi:hypothetical protein